MPSRKATTTKERATEPAIIIIAVVGGVITFRCLRRTQAVSSTCVRAYTRVIASVTR